MDNFASLPLGPIFDPGCPPVEAARNFFEVLRQRRSIRAFSKQPVSRETVEWLIRAATTAPSGANKQPWCFVAVEDPALKHAIRLGAEEEERSFYQNRASEAWLRDLAPLGTNASKDYLEIAPWLLVVFRLTAADDGSKTYYSNESVGIATGMLLAAAQHAGLCTLSHTPSPMRFLATILDRPAHEKPYMLIPLGYPAANCTVPVHAMKRKPLESVLHFHSSLWSILLLCLLLAGFSQQDSSTLAAASAKNSSLRILIANDDGVDSPGIAALAKSFAPLGEVVVCAPPSNRSGSSHSSTMFSGPVGLQEGSMEGAAAVWIVDGSPSDCVTFGLVHLGQEHPFDLVVSGVNRGNNVGLVAQYSGTVGAAMEGAMHGVLSVAVSQDVTPGSDGDYRLAAQFAAQFSTRLLQEKAPSNVVYNLNIPFSDAAQIHGVVVAPMGGSYIKVPSFKITGHNENRFARAQAHYNRKVPVGSDTALFQAGSITITPLRLDWTDRTMLKQMQKWQLNVAK